MNHYLPVIVTVILTLSLAWDAWRLWRNGQRPLLRAASALATLLILSVIPVWNTTLPVWLWWVGCAIFAVVVGLATWRALAKKSVIMER